MHIKDKKDNRMVEAECKIERYDGVSLYFISLCVRKKLSVTGPVDYYMFGRSCQWQVM